MYLLSERHRTCASASKHLKLTFELDRKGRKTKQLCPRGQTLNRLLLAADGSIAASWC